MDAMNCQSLAVPNVVMQHVVSVESAFNPYAIGIVGGHLVRQPRTLSEAVATARMLDARGYNFSVGLSQVNRHNLQAYGLRTYAQAFDRCPNLQAGARILARCHARSGGDWGRAFSCYYSGDFVTGFRTGYVDKVFASLRHASPRGRRPDRNEPAAPSASAASTAMPMTPIDRDARDGSDFAGDGRGFEGRFSPAAPGASRSSPTLPDERDPATAIQNASPIADAAFVF